jgi:hypothetical protein
LRREERYTATIDPASVQPGEERFEQIIGSDGVERFWYYYRAPGGELFTTDSITLETARRRAQEWGAVFGPTLKAERAPENNDFFLT